LAFINQVLLFGLANERFDRLFAFTALTEACLHELPAVTFSDIAAVHMLGFTDQLKKVLKLLGRAVEAPCDLHPQGWLLIPWHRRIQIHRTQLAANFCHFFEITRTLKLLVELFPLQPFQLGLDLFLDWDV
jgi:hypothetical protein